MFCWVWYLKMQWTLKETYCSVTFPCQWLSSCLICSCGWHQDGIHWLFGTVALTTVQTWNVYLSDCRWGAGLSGWPQAGFWPIGGLGCLAEPQRCWPEEAEYLQWPSGGARGQDRVSGPEHLQDFCRCRTFICSSFLSDGRPLVCWAEEVTGGNMGHFYFCCSQSEQTPTKALNSWQEADLKI